MFAKQQAKDASATPGRMASIDRLVVVRNIIESIGLVCLAVLICGGTVRAVEPGWRESLRDGHKKGIERYFRHQFVIMNDQSSSVATFVGGEDRALIEYAAVSGELFVDYASSDLAYRLRRDSGDNTFRVRELIRSSENEIDVAGRLCASNFSALGPFAYFEVPVVDFLEDPDVVVTRASETYDGEDELKFRVDWKSDDFEGYFVFCPQRNWALERFGRSKDLAVGEMGAIYRYSETDPNECLYVSRQEYKQFSGKPIENGSLFELAVIESSPSPPSRFRLSFYGLSDQIGIPKPRYLPYAILLGAVVLLVFWLQFREKSDR